MNKGLFSFTKGIPGWAWLFVIACLAIPVVALGGAIPIAVGLGGAMLCGGIARDASRPPGLRVTLCAVVTILAWVVFVVVLVGIARLAT